MALQEALIKSVNEFGKDVLIEPRLLNILNDYQGFNEMPYARFILKELQNDGILAAIIKMVSFDQLKTKQISKKIHNRFGFDIASVEQIISQVEYAIERFQVIATQEDLDNAWTDEKGVQYSQDRKRLLKASDKSIINYSVREGTTVICSDAFFDCQSLVHLDLLEGITHIGDYAFQFCNSLARLALPKTLKYMGINPFIQCSSIKYMICLSPFFSIHSHLVLNKNQDHVIGSFGDDRFIQVPKGITHIDEGAFYWNEAAQLVVLPYGVEHIATHAFRYCTALQSFIIPDSVKTVGESAFIECYSLQSILMPNELDYQDFSFCRSLKFISLPKNICSINDCAFLGCKSLRSIELHERIISIGEKAFYDCCSLESIIWSDNITRIEDDAFAFCFSLKSLVMPRELTHIGKAAFQRCDTLESVSFFNKVRQIEKNAFNGCKVLSSLYIPQGMRSHFERLLPSELHDKLIEK